MKDNMIVRLKQMKERDSRAAARQLAESEVERQAAESRIAQLERKLAILEGVEDFARKQQF